ncbi:hypothetical protein Bcep18194_C6896 [Burkholderia lata]|uniref:Uncharacterized protein n=1 Tax=Burkholderia lata (strain ATCC 17760 / DSM 23089 / LMG 22485 / NCIMB 9086 / R18194 / 383) TaxID=482957 RepID=Q39NM4_BURL3|nr:hypothetical protein Bcep18194_C6896 [Burkholderia lata]
MHAAVSTPIPDRPRADACRVLALPPPSSKAASHPESPKQRDASAQPFVADIGIRRTPASGTTTRQHRLPARHRGGVIGLVRDERPVNDLWSALPNEGRVEIDLPRTFAGSPDIVTTFGAELASVRVAQIDAGLPAVGTSGLRRADDFGFRSIGHGQSHASSVLRDGRDDRQRRIVGAARVTDQAVRPDVPRIAIGTPACQDGDRGDQGPRQEARPDRPCAVDA